MVGLRFAQLRMPAERLQSAIEAGAIPESVAIDDNAAVLFEGGSVAKVLSWRNGATAFAISLAQSRAVEIPNKATKI